MDAKFLGARLSARVPPNARNASMIVTTGAAAKAVPCQNRLCTQTLLEGTAYDSRVERRPPAPGGPLAVGFLEEFSHPGSVEASPGRPPRTRFAALGYPAVGADAAGADLGLWRCPGGALRDGARLRRRLPAQAPPARSHDARLLQS